MLKIRSVSGQMKVENSHKKRKIPNKSGYFWGFSSLKPCLDSPQICFSEKILEPQRAQRNTKEHKGNARNLMSFL